MFICKAERKNQNLFNIFAPLAFPFLHLSLRHNIDIIFSNLLAKFSWNQKLYFSESACKRGIRSKRIIGSLHCNNWGTSRAVSIRKMTSIAVRRYERRQQWGNSQVTQPPFCTAKELRVSIVARGRSDFLFLLPFFPPIGWKSEQERGLFCVRSRSIDCNLKEAKMPKYPRKI